MDLNYEVMRIRMIEEALSREYPKQEMRTPIHLSLGQESAAVGVCAVLPKNSLMVSTHRSHAHYLAKGGNLKRMIAELYGKSAGCSGGAGGSMHLVDWSCGFSGSTSIVGGTIPVGVGLAFADKLRGSNRITAVMIGDAAIEEGVFHESANFASLHQLNVLFVVEDNDRSCYTTKAERQPPRSFKAIAKGHNLGFTGAYRTQAATHQIARYTKRALRDLPHMLYLPVVSRVEHCGPKTDDGYVYKMKLNSNREAFEKIEKEIEEAFKWAKSVS